MAINKNHEFEDLDGVKCAVVEKNATPARVDFLKKLLELNKYAVVVVKSPPPKAAAPVDPNALPPVLPDTYTVGVTDVTFNMINAVFGRLLRAPDGHIVTLAYWQQRDAVTLDDVPYYEK